MRDVTGAQVSELHAALHNLGLANIQRLLNAEATKDIELTGTANGKVDASWRKTFDTLIAHTDAELKGTVTKAQSAPLSQEASVHATYSAAKQELSFEQSFIRLPQTTISLNGTVSKIATLNVQVQSNDLREVETTASAFGAVPQPLGLGGSATFNGTVRGSTTDPQIAGQLSATSLEVKGTEWRTVRTAVDANPSHVALRNGELVPASNRGRMTFNVSVGLDRWTFHDTDPLQIDINATQSNIAELKSLAGVQTAV